MWLAALATYLDPLMWKHDGHDDDDVAKNLKDEVRPRLLLVGIFACEKVVLLFLFV